MANTVVRNGCTYRDVLAKLELNDLTKTYKRAWSSTQLKLLQSVLPHLVLITICQTNLISKNMPVNKIKTEQFIFH